MHHAIREACSREWNTFLLAAQVLNRAVPSSDVSAGIETDSHDAGNYSLRQVSDYRSKLTHELEALRDEFGLIDSFHKGEPENLVISHANTNSMRISVRDVDFSTFWRMNATTFPSLTPAAVSILCLLTTSGSPERLFSKAELVVTDRSLSQETMKASSLIVANREIAHRAVGDLADQEQL
jgi:hypothetical protein